MSDSSVPVHESRSKPAMPEYFRADERKRQEFLSQVGTFSDEQRGIFNRLCDLFDPEISYSKAAVKTGLSWENSPFKSLMARLQSGHCGLVKFIWKNQQLEPHEVILTDRQSIRFYYHFIESEMQKNFLDDTVPFVNQKALAESGYSIPESMIETLAPEGIKDRLFRDSQDQVRIYRLEGVGQKGILVTPYSIRTLISICRFKVRSVLANNLVLSTVSRYTGKKINDLEREVRTDDPMHWTALTEALLQNHEDFLIKHKNITKSTFTAAQIILFYVKNEVADATEQRKEDNRKRDVMREICKTLEKKENLLLSQQELNDLIEPQMKEWPDFKDQFYENHVKVKEKTGLPDIVFTGKAYIHRDHIYPLYRQELQETADEYEKYYIDIMEKMIRTRNRDNITIFTNRDSFKLDIRARIREEKPFLDSMLGRPRIMSEAIIHYGKTTLKIKSIERMKELLVRYFNEGVIQFRDIDFLLGLYLKDIFDSAFQRLGFFRRLMMKLTGQYDTYITAFIGLSRVTMAPQNTKALDSHLTARLMADSRTDLRGDRVMVPRSERHRSSPQYVQPVKKKPQQDNSSKYSRKQIDQAWSEFDNAFYKTKGKDKKT
jgi:hypothetical protein